MTVRTTFLEDASRSDETAEPSHRPFSRRYVAPRRGRDARLRVLLDALSLTAAFLGLKLVHDDGVNGFVPWGVFFCALVLLQLACNAPTPHASAPRSSRKCA